ncbi:baculoviral IAP repeat-containing protein 3-like [Lineus longissimus]|uniref:baculoviral IAP repeat-containing protein 3-like n=1 Tax=Lineus longissimus TaxID=88925 RepID=UPI00315C7915
MDCTSISAPVVYALHVVCILGPLSEGEYIPTNSKWDRILKDDEIRDIEKRQKLIVLEEEGCLKYPANGVSSSATPSDGRSKADDCALRKDSRWKSDNSTNNQRGDCFAERSTNTTKPLVNRENSRLTQNIPTFKGPLSRTRNSHSCNNILSSSVVRNGSSDDDEDLYREPRGKGDASSATNAHHQMHQTRAPLPDFSDKGQRTLSFRNWSNPHRCSTSEASEAGLFYPGHGNGLLCHYCGAFVEQLTSSDDAWIEHARVNPRCQFVRSAKGEGFIRMVQEMYDNDIDEGTLERELNLLEVDDRRQLQETNTNSRHIAPPTTSTSGAVSSTSNSGRSSNVIKTPSASNDVQTPYTLPRRIPPIPPSTKPAPKAQRRPRTQKRQVQAREVRARLDLDWAQELLRMGYSNELLGAVISEQLIYEGDDFKSFKDMLMATIDAADQRDSYPVMHYALGLSQETSMSTSGVGTKPVDCAGALRATASRTTCSNAVAALSVGATSWTETTTPSGNRRNTSTPSGQSNSVTTANLKTENRELKERMMCKICFDMEANVVFLPCGHLVVCEQCSRRVRECPLCRRPISGVVKTYLS